MVPLLEEWENDVLQVISNKKPKGTIALDFDGVLHSYEEGWNGPIPKEEPINGSIKFVADLFELGYNVVIFSCRAKTEKGKTGIANWLRKYHFPEMEILYEKPEALLYIDDKGCRFDGSFLKALNFVKKVGQ